MSKRNIRQQWARIRVQEIFSFEFGYGIPNKTMEYDIIMGIGAAIAGRELILSAAYLTENVAKSLRMG